MADETTGGKKEPKLSKEQITNLLAQFVDAKRVNAQIDAMFAPMISRLKKDASAKDFSLLSLFFKKEDTTEIKKHIKDNIAKVMKEVKTEKLIDSKITIKPNIKINVKPIDITPKVKLPKAAKQQIVKPKEVEASAPTQPKEVFGSIKNKNTNIVEIAGIEKLISRVIQQSDQQQSAFQSVVKTLVQSKSETKATENIKSGESAKDIIKSKNAINVNIVGIDEHAVKQLAGVLKTKEEKREAPIPKKIEAPGGWITSLLGAVMSGFTAAKLLAVAFGNDGPLRGSLKLIGDVLLKASSMMFKSVISGITRFIQLLPESILSKLSAAATGITEIGSTMAKTVGNIVARVGGYIAKMGSFLIEGLAKISPVLAKGVSFMGGGLAKLAKGFGSFLLKRIKILPFIGPFIGFGFAVKRMMDGDYVGGLAEMLGNLLAIVAEPIPPLSFAISILTDLLLAGYDIKTGGIKNSKNSSWNKWLGEFGQALLDTGPIRWLRDIGEALGDLLSGNWREGLIGLANASTDLPWIGYIFDLLGAEKNKEGKRFTPKDFNILDKIKDEIYDKIMSVVNWAKDKINAVRKFFGLDTTKKPEAVVIPQKEIDKAQQARKLLQENTSKSVAVSKQPVVFEATRERKLNDLAVERTKLESQVENVAKRSKANKPVETPVEKPKEKQAAVSVETEQPTEQIFNEPEIVIQPASIEDKTEEIRRVEIEKARENNKDVINAIENLQKIQEKQSNRIMSIPEKKETPAPVMISAISNTVRSTNDINVDTARDNVYVIRNSIRHYLSLQRAMI